MTNYKLGVKDEIRTLDDAKAYAYDAVGEGWHGLLDMLFSNFEQYADEVTITQVKEKFGGLRVYLGPIRMKPKQRDTEYQPNLFDMAEFAETASEYICEFCGKRGRPEAGKYGWIKTVCEDHKEKKDD